MDPPKSEAGELNSTITLTCNATGQPPPKYTWFMIREGEAEVLTNESGPSLTFVNLMIQDRGKYFCSASNAVGTDNSSDAVAVLSVAGIYFFNQ